MPEDKQVRKSLAYRTHEEAIWNAYVPDKYRRVSKMVLGTRILELGSAEGVLTLLIAMQKGVFCAGVEMREERYINALNLQKRWHELGIDVSRATMIHADIRNNLNIFEGIDTLVAVRSLYYLREHAKDVVKAASKHVKQMVFCGNKNRAAAWRADPQGEAFNYLASQEGMVELVLSCGFEVTTLVEEGDPIVVGSLCSAAWQI